MLAYNVLVHSQLTNVAMKEYVRCPDWPLFVSSLPDIKIMLTRV